MFSNRLKDKKFCFTGAIQKKDENGKRFTRAMMHELVEENAGACKKDVTMDIDYLVQADPSYQSNKAFKAKRYPWIEIISEKQFFRMVIPKHIKNWIDKLKNKPK